jgi:large subunit ribosomal protein L29
VSTKRLKEIKSFTKDELTTKIREAEAQRFQVKMQLATAQLNDTASLWRLRKDIARMKTLQAGVQSKGSK